MTRTKSTFLALLAVLLSPMVANADLILVIEDAGSGQSLFTLAGSATLATGTGQTPNSVGWINTDAFSSSFLASPSGCFLSSIVSGSATASSSAGGSSSSMVDVVTCPDQNLFSPRWNASFTMDAGALLSWSGSLLVDIVFSTYIEGSYVTQDMAFGTLVSGDFYRMQIGSTSVPEPGTLALFGLGLAAMGISRRRKKI